VDILTAKIWQRSFESTLPLGRVPTRPSVVPSSQFSHPIEKPPLRPRWVHEINLDIDTDRAQLLTRTGLDAPRLCVDHPLFRAGSANFCGRARRDLRALDVRGFDAKFDRTGRVAELAPPCLRLRPCGAIGKYVTRHESPRRTEGFGEWATAEVPEGTHPSI
jgi:hypothetical protein